MKTLLVNIFWLLIVAGIAVTWFDAWRHSRRKDNRRW